MPPRGRGNACRKDPRRPPLRDDRPTAAAASAESLIGQRRHRRLLVVNPDAGSVNADLVTRLRKALPAWRYLEYDKNLRLADVLAAPGRVVVAGGDGAVGRVARQLLHSRNSLGIIPVGTANNFAHS